MCKAVAVLIFLAGLGSMASAAERSYFPNDPKLFASLEELRRLTDEPGSLHRRHSNSEAAFGDKRIVVLYASEGSGIIHEFGIVYLCDKGGRCILSAVAHLVADGDKQLVHKIDLAKGEIMFTHDGREVIKVTLGPSWGSPA